VGSEARRADLDIVLLMDEDGASEKATVEMRS